ncbi:MAG: acetylhydrolase [Casimicrobium sp.]
MKSICTASRPAYRHRRWAALAAGLLTAMGATSAMCQGLASLPAANAPIRAANLELARSDAFSTIDLLWNDASRQRDIPVRLYWPATASPSATVPLVVFSHGLGGSKNGYSYLGKYWASLGFASLHVQHAGSDRAVWGGNIFSLVSNVVAAASEANAMDRAKDVSFTITSILASKDFGPSIQANAIAVAGHSYGANTALLVGGATVERGGQTLSFRDDRVKALILISAPPFVGEGDMVHVLGPIKVPTLHVTGTDDVIRVPGYYSDLADRIKVFDAVHAPDKVLTVFKGATHSIFTDRTGPAGVELNSVVKRATRELSGVFLKSVLSNAPGKVVDDWLSAQKALLDRYSGAVRGGKG